jgi:hypothetical protein
MRPLVQTPVPEKKKEGEMHLEKDGQEMTGPVGPGQQVVTLLFSSPCSFLKGIPTFKNKQTKQTEKW